MFVKSSCYVGCDVEAFCKIKVSLRDGYIRCLRFGTYACVCNCHGLSAIPKPNVSRQVLSADQIPQIKAHPLDEKLKHMPTWQEQMLNPDGDVPELSESDDSDEDEDSEEANLRRQRKQEEKERAKKEAEAKRAAEEEESSVESDEDED